MAAAISTGPFSPDEDARETAGDDGIKVPPVSDVCVGNAADEIHGSKWLAENDAGFAAQSQWHERHGHPLEEILMYPGRDTWKSEPQMSCLPATASVEDGVTAAIRAEKATMWRLQNAGAIADYNKMIEANGIPLSEFRKF